MADDAGLVSFSFGQEEVDRHVVIWKKVRSNLCYLLAAAQSVCYTSVTCIMPYSAYCIHINFRDCKIIATIATR